MKTLLLTAIVLLHAETSVHGHAVLVEPPVRIGMGKTDQYPLGRKLAGVKEFRNKPVNINQADSGCGFSASTGNPGPGDRTVTWLAGSTASVCWETTIPHADLPNVRSPGVRVSIAYTPTERFDVNVLAKDLDAGTSGTHCQNITLPAGKTCEACVLQWMWVSLPDGGAYLGCADVRIQNPTTGETSATTTTTITDGMSQFPTIPTTTLTTKPPITDGMSLIPTTTLTTKTTITDGMSLIPTTTPTTTLSTATETIDLEKCTGGKGSGPPGYVRLCDGVYHGKCLGTIIATAIEVVDEEACADECTDADVCAGYELDTSSETACTLFSVVNGVNRTADGKQTTQECYIMEDNKLDDCESVMILFASHYKRMCDNEYHGECRGSQIGSTITLPSPGLCSEKCDLDNACGGFEYDVHDESRSCLLYGQVRGAERHQDNTHECYAKSNFVVPTTTTSVGLTTEDEETASVAIKTSIGFCVLQIFVMAAWLR